MKIDEDRLEIDEEVHGREGSRARTCFFHVLLEWGEGNEERSFQKLCRK